MATSTIRNLPRIVEQGTSGNWTYRKWSDGTAECWATIDHGKVNYNTKYGNGYYASSVANAFPNNFFVSAPKVQISMSDNGGYGTWFVISSISNTTVNGYPYTVASNVTVNCTLCIYAIGKWR